MRSGAAALVAAAVLAAPAPAGATGKPTVRHGSVVAGPVRVQVITPTLLRLEHALGGAFEDRPTFNVPVRRRPAPPFTARRAGRELRVRTSALLLRHRLGPDGRFTPANTTVRLLAARRTVRPRFGGDRRGDALGGWYRGLDSYDGRAGPVAELVLHPGLLHRSGWFLLDDTRTALRSRAGWMTERRSPAGYQDGYFFGYGSDYERGLADLRALTGPAVLLPRWAFGVWYSRYFPHAAAAYEQRVLPAFRAHDVPLDVLVVDTDWKAPDRWAGWSWSPALFPDPRAFLGWAAREGLQVTLNVHPAIAEADPLYPATQALAGGRLAPARRSGAREPARRFDWGDRAQARAYFALHAPFERLGVSRWWLDHCCEDSGVRLAGLTADSWINELYRRREEARGLRGFVLSRIGASFPGYRRPGPSGPWAEHRSTIHFTGDTRSDWPSLAFAAAMTPAEGSIGLPYVSHDIGGFLGRHLPDDLYLRWIQLGAFQPILRLHSHHGDRLPWDYPPPVRRAAAAYLRLRESLVPYLYATAREAHDSGLPMARPLYLRWPGRPAAYRHAPQYMLGDALLVAPVTRPGLVTRTRVWLPPGTWTNLFTGATVDGPGARTVRATPRVMPVYARAGAILPQAPRARNVASQPADALRLTVFPRGSGRTVLYDDAGEGLAYRRGAFARTPVRYTERRRPGRRCGGRSELAIGPSRGTYAGQPARRTYTVAFAGVARPCRVTVGGRAAAHTYRRARKRLVVRVGVPSRSRVTIAHDGRPVR